MLVPTATASLGFPIVVAGIMLECLASGDKEERREEEREGEEEEGAKQEEEGHALPCSLALFLCLFAVLLFLDHPRRVRPPPASLCLVFLLL